MPSNSHFNVRGTYTSEDIQKKTNYGDLERGAKGDIECSRSNKGDIEINALDRVGTFNAENLHQRNGNLNGKRGIIKPHTRQTKF